MPIPICSFSQYKDNHPRPALSDYIEEREQVRLIIDRVREKGDLALKEYTLRFDGAELDHFRVPPAAFSAALENVDGRMSEAIGRAKSNIEKFHRNQLSSSWWHSGPGWISGQRRLPLERVGIYIPGGTAPYPSSVLMTAVPARVAGVEEIYICTPPSKDGTINSLTLAAAWAAGVSAVFMVGGAQAVAAMAYGTETIPAVQKIVGPGNLYVTLAKREVYGQVGIDMLAGPSEIVIVADSEANPAYIAADLLSQAEHDPLSRAILITASPELPVKVREELIVQLNRLPRKETAARSLQEQGAIITVSSLDEAWPVVNNLAPEHLELHLADAWRYIDRVRNAGAIFVGPYTPESVGDYWAGSSHVLPTNGTARYASALGVADFVRSTHILSYTAEALHEAAPYIEDLAGAEGFDAHARAVSMRRRKDGPHSPD